MEVTSQNKDLALLLSEDPKASRLYGSIRLKLLKKRIGMLKLAKSLEDVRAASGHFHELVDDRKGQWACDIDQPYRLIFIPHEDPIPTDENGKYIWIEIKGVELIEVTNYHGK